MIIHYLIVFFHLSCEDLPLRQAKRGRCRSRKEQWRRLMMSLPTFRREVAKLSAKWKNSNQLAGFAAAGLWQSDGHQIGVIASYA